MMKRIQIETAANGYIATESSEDMRMIAYVPHVFETFESLTEWLSQHLEKPKANDGSAASG
jgi:hypothetical protein